MAQARQLAQIVALLLCAGGALARPGSLGSSERALLQETTYSEAPWVAASDLRTCSDVLKNSLSPPPEAIVAAVFAARGLENYTCSEEGRWKVLGSRKDIYDAVTGAFSGYIYTQVEDIENSIFIFTKEDNETVIGEALKDNQVTYDVKPLDWQINRKWWRRPLVTAKGVAAGSVMVIKTDVQGGMPPSKECEVGVDTLIEVPMNNTYTFYACANTPALPRDPKCGQPEIKESYEEEVKEGKFIVNWEVTGTGSRNWTCADGEAQFNGCACDISGDAEGACFYTEPVPGQAENGLVGYFVIDTPKGTYYMDPEAVTYQAAPSSSDGNATLDWAIWPVAKVRGEPLCDYIVRTDTTGGATPESCEGGELSIDYTAKYTCLQCP